MRYRYLLAILNGATRIIECGTSFGVTTIYMALAVNQNKRGQRDKDFGVFTIEKDGGKVVKAKSIWKEAGEDVENCIDAREGDVLAVLEQDEILPPVVDLVFLDGKYYPYAVSIKDVAYGNLSMDFTRTPCTKAGLTKIAEWVCRRSRQNNKREDTVS
jgi:predicted O-methyltransferase YrrM